MQHKRVVLMACVLVVSMGFFGCKVNVPAVVGLTQQDAENAITDAGLVVGDVGQSYDAIVPAGSVAAQSPDAGVRVAKSSEVDITVSLGPGEDVENTGPEGEYEVEGEDASDGMARIVIPERAGVARTDEYVTFGVPLPRDWDVANLDALCLKDGAGTTVPAQFEALARWGAPPLDGGAAIKWVLATTAVTVPASATGELFLDLDAAAAPPASLVVDTAAPGRIQVDTGAATFEIITTGDFNLINQVTIDGVAVLEPLAAAAALAYAPADGQSIVGAGGADFTARATTAVLEREGPLWAVVRVRGSILDGSNRAILDFTARLHFHAGSSQVRVDFTVENNHPLLTTVEGQPSNAHNQGAVNSVYVGQLQLRLRLANTGAAVNVFTESEVAVSALDEALTLYQDSSGTAYWRAYVGNVGWPGETGPAAPRCQSYCTLDGYRISGGGLGTPVTGRQALGWMSASRDAANAPRITVAVRDFWENFPKALSAAPDGTIAVDLFPNGNHFRHNLRIGEQKTHTLLFDFGLGAATREEAHAIAAAFDQPLLAAPSPAWFVTSGALPETPGASVSTWPLYERYVRTAFEPNPDFDPAVDDPSFGNSTLRNALYAYNFFGWQDYGDVPIDYEAFGPNQAGQINLKYWYLNGFLTQFCRTGDRRWLDLALPGARHLSDLDFLHIPDAGASHWSHGAYFGHSQHDEPGNLNPNRNSNSPSVDLFFGVMELLFAYHLTGEVRFAEVALEGLVSMEAMSAFANFGDPFDFDPVLTRDRANMIIAYIEGYRHTGDAHWLAQLRSVVAPTVDLSNKGWVTDPAAYGRAHPGANSKMFQFNQILWSLGRYLDFLEEYGLPDDLGVIAALTAYGDFVLNHAMVEYAPGRACHPYEYYFDGSDESYPDINNWALVMADGLAYVYKYTGEARFLDAAAMFYATGTIDPQWEGDAPIYLDAKGLVNALNWGLVYMNQSRL